MELRSYLGEDTLHEVARLIRQGRRFTEEQGPLLSQEEWTTTWRVLDIGCGPGGWVLDTACAFPHVVAVGIDTSQRMISTAQSLARAEHVPNAQFFLMDALQPFDFPEPFDLIHCRLASSFMGPADWPRLIQTCFRLLRPGGHLELIDLEAISSNSAALEKAAAWLYQMHQRTSRSFSTTGMSVGITFMFPVFLRKAGFELKSMRGVVLNVCHGAEGFDVWRENHILMNATFRSHALALGIATESELDQNLEEVLQDMNSEDFAAAAYHVWASGIKPR